MYGKIFEQIFDSSIMKEDVITRYVFIGMVTLSDDEGFIDMTAEAIGRRIGLAEKDVQKAIQELEKPDKTSRTPDEEGARIIKIRESFGWQVINKKKYALMANRDTRKEYMRNYMKSRREKECKQPVNKRKQLVANVTHTDRDTDTYRDKDKKNNPSGKLTHEFIKEYLSLFNKEFGFFPDITKKQAGVAHRLRKRIGARWKEFLASAFTIKKHYDLDNNKKSLESLERQINTITIEMNKGKTKKQKENEIIENMRKMKREANNAK